VLVGVGAVGQRTVEELRGEHRLPEGRAELGVVGEPGRAGVTGAVT